MRMGGNSMVLPVRTLGARKVSDKYGQKSERAQNLRNWAVLQERSSPVASQSRQEDIQGARANRELSRSPGLM
jgi:hypothetical protein